MNEDYRQDVERLAAELEAEAAFDLADYLSDDENGLPDAIADYLSDVPDDASGLGVDDAYEAWRENAQDGMLEAYARAKIYANGTGTVIEHIVLVLGTGGPHVELRIDPDTGRGVVVKWGWWMEGYAECSLDIAGHPYHGLAQLIAEMVEMDR